MAHKLKKPTTLYMPPELINKAGSASLAGSKGAACGGCMMFLSDISACSILSPEKVSAKRGVCGLFVGGKPATSKDHKPMKLVPSDVAGYYEGVGAPTHCGNCKNFRSMKGEAVGMCAVVAGSVHEDGCCNAWGLGVKPVRGGKGASPDHQGLRGLMREST